MEFKPRQKDKFKPYNSKLERAIDQALISIHNDPELNKSIGHLPFEDQIRLMLEYGQNQATKTRGGLRVEMENFISTFDPRGKDQGVCHDDRFILCEGRIGTLQVSVKMITDSDSFIFDSKSYRGTYEKISNKIEDHTDYTYTFLSRYHHQGQTYDSMEKRSCCGFCASFWTYTYNLSMEAKKLMEGCTVTDAKEILLYESKTITKAMRNHLVTKHLSLVVEEVDGVNLMTDPSEVPIVNPEVSAGGGRKKILRLSTSWSEASIYGEYGLIKEEERRTKGKMISYLRQLKANGATGFMIEDMINSFLRTNFHGKGLVSLETEEGQMLHMKRMGMSVSDWNQLAKLIDVKSYGTINKIYGAYLQKCCDERLIYLAPPFACFIPWHVCIFGLLDWCLVEEIVIETFSNLEHQYSNIYPYIKSAVCLENLRILQLRLVQFRSDPENDLFCRSYVKGGFDAFGLKGHEELRKEYLKFNKVDLATFGFRDTPDPRKEKNFFVNFVNAMETTYEQFEKYSPMFREYLLELYGTGYQSKIPEGRKKPFLAKLKFRAPNLTKLLNLYSDDKPDELLAETVTLGFDMKKICDKVGGRVTCNNESKILDVVLYSDYHRTWDYRVQLKASERYPEYTRPFNSLHLETDTAFRWIGYGKDSLVLDACGNLIIRAEYSVLDIERDEIFGLDPLSQARWDGMHETMSVLAPYMKTCRFLVIIWGGIAFPDDKDKCDQMILSTTSYFTRLGIFSLLEENDRSDTKAKKWKKIYNNNFIPSLYKFLIENSRSLGSSNLERVMTKESLLWRGFVSATDIVTNYCSIVSSDEKKSIEDVIQASKSGDEFKLYIRNMNKISEIQTVPQYNCVNHVLRPMDRLVDADDNDKFDTNELINKSGPGLFSHTNRRKENFGQGKETFYSLVDDNDEQISSDSVMNCSAQMLMEYQFALNPISNFFIKKVEQKDDVFNRVEMVDIDFPKREKIKCVFLDSETRNDDAIEKYNPSEGYIFDYHSIVDELRKTDELLGNWMDELMRFREGKDSFVMDHSEDMKFPEGLKGWCHEHQWDEIPLLWYSYVYGIPRILAWTPSAGKAIEIVLDCCGIIHTNIKRTRKELVLVVTPKTAKDQMIKEFSRVRSRFDLRFVPVQKMNSNLPDYMILSIYREKESVLVLYPYNVGHILRRVEEFEEVNESGYWNTDRMLYCSLGRVSRIHWDESGNLLKEEKNRICQDMARLEQKIRIIKKMTKEEVNPKLGIAYYTGSPAQIGNSCLLNHMKRVGDTESNLETIKDEMSKIKNCLDERNIHNTKKSDLDEHIGIINSIIKENDRVSVVSRKQLNDMFLFDYDILILFFKTSPLQDLYYSYLIRDIHNKSSLGEDLEIEDEDRKNPITREQALDRKNELEWRFKMILNRKSPKLFTDIDVERSIVMCSEYKECKKGENPKSEACAEIWELCKANNLRRAFFSSDLKVLKFQQNRVVRKVRIDKVDDEKDDVFVLNHKTKPSLRNSRVEKFNKSDPPSNLFSTFKVGGIGMNIQGADVNVGTDSFHLADDNVQWIRRTVRYGRESNTLVLQLLCAETVEEIIFLDCMKRMYVQYKLVFDEDVKFPDSNFKNYNLEVLKEKLSKYFVNEKSRLDDVLKSVEFFVDQKSLFTMKQNAHIMDTKDD